jgi:hypothetical protein
MWCLGKAQNFLQIPASQVFLLLYPELRAGAGAGTCTGANFGVLNSKVHVLEN